MIIPYDRLKKTVRLWRYFSGIGWLPETEPGIMNKYIAGTFRASARGVPDTKEWLREQVPAKRVEEIVILCKEGLS